MRIYLVGFMGSGKTTLGRQVADQTCVPFFDTDTVIESQSGHSISEIFDLQSEQIFRELENDVIRQSLIYDKALIATGGGLPCHNDNMAWMSQHGVTIYLQWPDEKLISNLLLEPSSRPLLSYREGEDSRARIASLLSGRKMFYEMAAITIEMQGQLDADNLTLQKACKYIW
jgi:shikimate kinase